MVVVGRECLQCAYFKPHIYYPYLGLCMAKREIVSSAEEVRACPSFESESLHRLREALALRGWVYCVSCGKTLTTTEELEEHGRRGHTISDDVLVDDVVAEEAPSGD